MKPLWAATVLTITAVAAVEAAARDAEPNRMLQKAVVDSFLVKAGTQAGSAEVTLYGLLPSPAYEIERIVVRRRGGRIDITPLMRYDPGKIVIMMNVPYRLSIALPRTRRKSVTVRVIDARQVREQKVTFSAVEARATDER